MKKKPLDRREFLKLEAAALAAGRWWDSLLRLQRRKSRHRSVGITGRA